MKDFIKSKREARFRRHQRVKAKLFGTKDRPRLCVFRSSKHIYVQLIDDEKGSTLLTACDQNLKKPKRKEKKEKTKIQDKNLAFGKNLDSRSARIKKTKETQKPLGGKVAIAFEVGKLIAEKAGKKKIKKVVFDRGGYKYHGRVKALAEGAREGGLMF